MSSGLQAVSAAAISPARREISLARGRVGDRDDGHPGQRRQRAQPGLAVAEHPRPHPRDAVVQRRRRLGLRDQPEHLARREVDEQRGVGLVEPEALVAEPVEAQHGREHGQRADGQRAAATRSWRAAASRCSPAIAMRLRTIAHAVRHTPAGDAVALGAARPRRPNRNATDVCAAVHL